jgi:alpha 1,2-mannosyltransferase
MDSLDYLGTIGVGKGHMLSYHAMIRWQSGFFYQHPALDSYDWYWRVEPDVHFFCDVAYDPFRFLAENDLVYGFNMAILDDARSFASLWSVTRDFIAQHPHLVHPDADVDWLLDPHNAMEYNNCQFFSNFEIGSLAFFRAEPNRKYFEHLDRSGGFFYERYGDAPVHTLSLALFARKDQVWFFRDIGYQHDTARHCPPPPSSVDIGNGNGKATNYHEHRCTCEPTGLDENFYKLVPMESPQVKPRDTCIRLWLGSDWLDKKPGWSQDVERAFGGDGYGGYVLDGLSS